MDRAPEELDPKTFEQDPESAPSMGLGGDDLAAAQAARVLMEDLNAVRKENQVEQSALMAEEMAHEVLSQKDPITGLPRGFGPSDILAVMDEVYTDAKSSWDKKQAGFSLPPPEDLAPKPPRGLTDMRLEAKPAALSVLRGAFPSMNELGILRDPQDRMSYSQALLRNENMSSTLRARMAQQAMKDGKVVLEALSQDWYESAGLDLGAAPPPGEVT